MELKYQLFCLISFLLSFLLFYLYTIYAGKIGFIDKTGKLIIPATYDECFPFKNGLAYVKLNNKYGYINSKGKIIVPIAYDVVNEFSEDMAMVKKDKKYGYVKKSEDKEIILYCNSGAVHFPKEIIEELIQV